MPQPSTSAPAVSQLSSSPLVRSLSPEELLEQTQVLDDLMDDIGMGKFQKQLLVLCGLGWFADNMWLQCIALILPRVQAQFEIRDQYIGILSSSMFVGMMFGAMFWGTLSDIYGRKQAFNFTLIVTSIFGIAAGFANSYWLLCLLILALGFGEAAVVLCRIFKINHKDTQSEAFDENIETLTLRFNRPVDAGDASSSDESTSSGSDIYETDLSDAENPRNTSNGRRRMESSNGNRTRRQNGNESENGNGNGSTGIQHYRPPGVVGSGNGNDGDNRNRTWISFQRYRRRYKHKIERALERLGPLFVPEFRLSTILIWTIWALVAFAYTAFNVFYPKFLQEHGQGGHQPLQLVYLDILIYSAAGVPGSVLATVMVEGRLGRRYTMAVSTFGTALATILFAVLSSRAAMTTFSAILSLLATLNYAVLYSYTPEVFPSDIRGTACGVAAAVSRLAGIITPLIVGAMLSVNTYFPLYTASVMFFVSAVCMCFLPIETKGRAAT
ncbi:hypothetical protein BGZ96_007312 [Linnemannia gamsii]|uniref:Major facilitator superfamily (MFS) profile domain-containing protein n=1 Tax=Linnemannia gamsii TaxID=64522 RepID=A0ABQ7K1D8_9FUNG|nr:hypothetical protein BGZ96_007312 [Linnemannia gamsii]